MLISSKLSADLLTLGSTNDLVDSSKDSSRSLDIKQMSVSSLDFKEKLKLEESLLCELSSLGS